MLDPQRHRILRPNGRSMGYLLWIFDYMKWLFDYMGLISCITLQWRQNEHDGVLNHRRLHWLLNCWFKWRSKKPSKLRITGLCVGNWPATGEFPAQNTENFSIWWRHHETVLLDCSSTGGKQRETLIGIWEIGFIKCANKPWDSYIGRLGMI